MDDGGVLAGTDHESRELTPVVLLPTGDAGPYGCIADIHNELFYSTRIPARTNARVVQVTSRRYSPATMSIFHPVSLAAKRAFCPSLPMASES